MEILYIIIFVIVVMICILGYLLYISNKTSSIDKIDIALQKSGISKLLQDNFAFDVVYNNILSNK